MTLMPQSKRLRLEIATAAVLSAVPLLLLSMNPATAQTAPIVTKPGPQLRSSRSLATARKNQQIARLIQEIDAQNIERSIRKLVSFGTRNTLSTQNDPKRGIGAARDWLFSEFSKAAESSDGRMSVEKQTFEQPKAARIPQPTML